MAKLVAPPPAAEVEAAEAKVKKAELDLAEAQTKLGYAQVVAPIDGTVLELSITAGERGTVGKVVATLADTSKLKLTVKVAEVDITKIQTGQVVEIAIDAIRGRTFAGVIDSIAPINQSDKDVVNYPVTIQLTDTNLDGVRPGMNAVVTLTDPQSAAGGWLVPTTALKALPGGQAQVLVQRGEELAPVTVVPGAAQGEWTLVQSPDLHAGDKVQGSVTSYVDQQPEPGLAWCVRWDAGRVVLSPEFSANTTTIGAACECSFTKNIRKPPRLLFCASSAAVPRPLYCWPSCGRTTRRPKLGLAVVGAKPERAVQRAWYWV